MTLANEVRKRFFESLVASPDDYKESLQSLQDYINDNNMIFHGKPIPYSLQPLAVTEQEAEYFGQVTELLSDVLETALAAYFTDPYVEEFFAYYRPFKSVIDIQPRYQRRIRLSRYDTVWYGGGHFKIFECNTCCPGGVVILGQIKQHWLRLPATQRAFGKAQSEMFLTDTPDGFINEILAAYREAGGTKQHPTIVLGHYDGRYQYELAHMREYMSERGLEAVVCDLRDLTLHNDDLWHKDQIIDVVYFKVDQAELVSPGLNDVLTACKTGAVVGVNSFAAQFISESKMILALLHDEVFRSRYLSAAQIATIDRHVPWTQVLKDTQVRYRGETKPLSDICAEFQRDLVLKIDNGTRGADVIIGRTVSATGWQQLIAKHKNSHWIIQEYCPIPEIETLVVGDALVTEPRKFGIDMFMLGGHFAGIVSRISSSSVINVGQSGFEQPVVVLRKPVS